MNQTFSNINKAPADTYHTKYLLLFVIIPAVLSLLIPCKLIILTELCYCDNLVST